MNDFLSKPFDPKLLVRKVRSSVEAARGQHIPLIRADDQTVGPLAGAQYMSSIDAAVVRQMFGEDTALFESLAMRLLREYADLAVPRLDLTDDVVSTHELRQRLHKLKGSAGMIGASTVAALAGAAEAALQKDRPVEGILTKLGCALILLREELQPLLERRSDLNLPQGNTAAGISGINDVDMEDLHELLQSQNLAAIAKCSALAPLLTARLGTVDFERLRASVDKLDFSRAAQVLLDARRRGLAP